MTKELFRTDSYLKACKATVTALAGHAVILDQTIFYPTGGGQPGDIGRFLHSNGTELTVVDTRKDRETGQLLHILSDDTALPAIGDQLTLEIEWDRRHQLMRMHTCMHLLCAIIPCGVTGGQVGTAKSRLDFDLSTGQDDYELDKESITKALNDLIAQESDISMSWITDAEMDQKPELVRTMSVQPPRGAGQVRLIKVGDVDLQPCGGTHVANTREIGPVRIGKIESKGKRNKRINILMET